MNWQSLHEQIKATLQSVSGSGHCKLYIWSNYKNVLLLFGENLFWHLLAPELQAYYCKPYCIYYASQLPRWMWHFIQIFFDCIQQNQLLSVTVLFGLCCLCYDWPSYLGWEARVVVVGYQLSVMWVSSWLLCSFVLWFWLQLFFFQLKLVVFCRGLSRIQFCLLSTCCLLGS